MCDLRGGSAGEAAEGVGPHEQAGAGEAGVDERLASAQKERNQEGREMFRIIKILYFAKFFLIRAFGKR